MRNVVNGGWLRAMWNERSCAELADDFFVLVFVAETFLIGRFFAGVFFTGAFFVTAVLLVAFVVVFFTAGFLACAMYDALYS
jgi:hypothetical protein